MPLLALTVEERATSHRWQEVSRSLETFSPRAFRRIVALLTP